MMPGPMSGVKCMDNGTYQQVESIVEARTTKQVKLVVIVVVAVVAVAVLRAGERTTTPEYFPSLFGILPAPHVFLAPHDKSLLLIIY